MTYKVDAADLIRKLHNRVEAARHGQKAPHEPHIPALVQGASVNNEALTGYDKEAADLVKALGIDPHTCQRLVLDLPCDGVARMWVQTTTSTKTIPSVIEILKSSPKKVELANG